MTTLSSIVAEAGTEAAHALKIIESMPGHAWSADADGRFTYVSPNTLAFLSEARENLGPSESEDEFGWRRVVHPDDYDRVAARWRHCLRTGDQYDTEHRLRRADGAYRWFRNSGRPSRDDQGRITGWHGTTIDINEQKQAEAALRKQERELSQLVDMVPSHLWRLMPDGEPIFFNKRMVDFLGLNVADTDKLGKSRLEAVIETVIHPDDAAEFRDTLSNCLATGESFAARYRLRRADGVYRWMSSHAEPMRDEHGHIVQWYGLCHDIDDQMRADEALRLSESRLRHLVDALPAMIWCTTPEGKPSYVNKRFTEVTSATLEDITAPNGAFSFSVIHPADKDKTAAAVRRSFTAGVPYVIQYRQLRRGGSYRWTETRAEALRDEFGNILQWYGLSVDIHDLFSAQEALRRSEQELQQLVDALPVHVWSWTPDGKLAYVNKRSLEELGLFGASFEDCARVAQNLVHPEDAPEVLRISANCLKTGDVFAMRYRRRWKDGNYRWIEARCEPLRDRDGTIVHWYQISIDVDDEVRTQDALRQSERRLRQLIDAVPVHFWTATPAGLPSYISKRTQEHLEINLADFEPLEEPRNAERLRQTIFEKTHPEDAAENQRKLAQSLKAGEKHVARFRRCGKDGVYRWTEGRLEPQRDQDGKILQWCGVSLDIDDEVRAQEASRESERFLRQLVETLPAMIYCATPKGEPTYRSRQLREYLGFNVGDRVAEGSRLTGTLDSVIHPDELAAVKEHYSHSLATGEPYLLRHRLQRIDGEYRWVETRAAAMRNAEGAIVQWNGICLDIEDQVRAQDNLRLAQETLARAGQAASFAELSASIAHEVNQPLAAIVFNSHACHRWLLAEPPNLDRAKITVERIIRDANSAADVVSRIRALFKQSMESRDSTTLASVVAEVRNLMTEEAARRRVRVVVDIENNLPLVVFDRVQIQQVLINLMRNGLDAMDSTAGDRILGIRVRRMGDVLQTEISDRGQGVEFPDKVFEPFYTTKEHGMGMGLAICRSIVESHGGRLWTVRNEPHGAMFIFTLPIGMKMVS